jgi:copper oxidase (laccase) domain-containing protein
VKRVHDTKIHVVPSADNDDAHDLQALETAAPVEPLSGAAAAVRLADCLEVLLQTDP